MADTARADTVDEYGLPMWPAAERNKQPILDVLVSLLEGRRGTFVEIASATGQHIEHFARALSNFAFIPTDYDEEHLTTLRARTELVALPHLHAPLHLDAASSDWPIGEVDVIYNANMVHIAPFEVAKGLFLGVGRHLKKDGLFISYGPYSFSGRHTSESNERFDASLKARDPSWGVRDVDDLEALARAQGIFLRETIAMPANNFILVWQRRQVAEGAEGEGG